MNAPDDDRQWDLSDLIGELGLVPGSYARSEHIFGCIYIYIYGVAQDRYQEPAAIGDLCIWAGRVRVQR